MRRGGMRRLRPGSAHVVIVVVVVHACPRCTFKDGQWRHESWSLQRFSAAANRGPGRRIRVAEHCKITAQKSALAGTSWVFL